MRLATRIAALAMLAACTEQAGAELFFAFPASESDWRAYVPPEGEAIRTSSPIAGAGLLRVSSS